MAAEHFHLINEWKLDAPIEPVRALLKSVEEWPSWWRAEHRVEELQKGDANDLGAVYRMAWKMALSYQLTFNMRRVASIRSRLLEGARLGSSMVSAYGHCGRTAQALTCETTGTLK